MITKDTSSRETLLPFQSVTGADISPSQVGGLQIHDIQGTGLASPLLGQTVVDVPDLDAETPVGSIIAELDLDTLTTADTATDTANVDTPVPATSALTGLRIHNIQGTGLTSPLVGKAVVAVPGIVTAVASNGSYLQDPHPDDNPESSDGIFVFTGSRELNVRIGDSVLVSGTVTEFQPGGATSNNLTITQISASRDSNEIAILSSGNALPAPSLIGAGGRIPPTQVISPDGILFYESLEGMQVTVQDAMAVSPTSTFSSNSEIWVVADQGAEAENINDRGGITIAPDNFNPERIQIDDGLLPNFTNSPVNVGDALGDVTGVVSYAFGNYEVLVTQPYFRSSGGLQRETTDLVGTDDQLLVASYNVENLNPFSGVRFESLAAQITDNLNAPDIIALQEIQDNNGPINDGTVAADRTYQALIDAIAAAGGPTYEFVNIDPENNQDGGQPGSNIRVGYLYNPERVSLVSDSVRRLVDTNLSNGDAFQASRKPLVASFEFDGEEVTLINNHLTSRGGSTPLFGDVQPPIIRGEEQRTEQAQIINTAVNEILAEDPGSNVVVLGDMNGFYFENFMQQVLEGGDNPVLTNLYNQLPEAERYSYVFQGNSQGLDHILVSNNLADAAVFDPVHVNSEFTEQESDHDPLVALLDLSPEPTDFTLQILHASDGEAGVPAFRDIAGFSAVMNALEGQYENTLKLNTGDAYQSSPFFNASRDVYDNATTGRAADAPGIADILINNELGWDVASVGNHEFSGGAGNFFQLVAPNPNWVNGAGGGVGIGEDGFPGTAFPYLANNLDYSEARLPEGLEVVPNGGEPLPNTLTGSVVKEINGEQIGMIGIVTPYLRDIADIGSVVVTTRDAEGNAITNRSPISVQVDSIIANITPEVEAMTSAGVNKIFLMTHLQESRIEQELAQRIAELGLPVDILFGGGSHQVMTSEETIPPLREDETQQLTGQTLTPFPQRFSSGENQVLFVNSAANYRYLNQLVVTFDAEGQITDIEEDSGPYATDIAGVDRLYDEEITTLEQVRDKADAEVIEILDGVQGFVDAQDGNIFGQTGVFLNGRRGAVRTQETNLGNLSSDSQIFYANAYLETYDLLPGFDEIDISFRNGGGIRDSIGVDSFEPTTGELINLPPQANPNVGKEEGDVSQLDIANSLRFNNPLAVGTVTAEGLLQIAEHMVSAVEDISGRFGQIGGFRFSYDPEAPAGERILSLALADGSGNSTEAIVADGELVVDPSRTFSVVTSLNLATGAIDGYPAVIENIVSLLDYEEPDSLGRANLVSGRDQDALAEYLAAIYNRENDQAPFFTADTPESEDERIQNLNFRNDTILDDIIPVSPTLTASRSGWSYFGEEVLSMAARNSNSTQIGDQNLAAWLNLQTADLASV